MKTPGKEPQLLEITNTDETIIDFRKQMLKESCIPKTRFTPKEGRKMNTKNKRS